MGGGRTMVILFVHQNFPGQYLHLAPALRDRGARIVAIGGATARAGPGIALHRYNPLPARGVPPCHGWAADFQAKCLRAEAVAQVLERLLQDGLTVDLVVGHSGWGELLAVKDLLPSTPVLHQVEFVYQVEGGDAGFDPEFARSGWRARTQLRMRRAHQLLAFQDLDWGLAPTYWQASTAPDAFRNRISVIHEGIDTQLIAPRPDCSVTLRQAGLRFLPGDELVSFAARNLEPYRGFHVFMRMLPLLQSLRPRCHVVIVGSNGVSYGSPPACGGSWRDALLRELEGRLDLSRIHFVGQVPHPVLHDLFRVSACHVYLSYPFVLSWSLLEAMACEAVVVGSATPPVQEVIEHGVNGLLVDFFGGEELAMCINSVLADRAAHRPLAEAARQTVTSHYDLNSVCLPQQIALVGQVARHEQPTSGQFR